MTHSNFVGSDVVFLELIPNTTNRWLRCHLMWLSGTHCIPLTFGQIGHYSSQVLSKLSGNVFLGYSSRGKQCSLGIQLYCICACNCFMVFYSKEHPWAKGARKNEQLVYGALLGYWGYMFHMAWCFNSTLFFWASVKKLRKSNKQMKDKNSILCNGSLIVTMKIN